MQGRDLKHQVFSFRRMLNQLNLYLQVKIPPDLINWHDSQ